MINYHRPNILHHSTNKHSSCFSKPLLTLLTFSILIIIGYIILLNIHVENSQKLTGGELQEEIPWTSRDEAFEKSLTKSTYKKSFDLLDLVEISKNTKIYIYEEFLEFNFKLFENDGIQLPNEVLKFKNLDVTRQDILENLKNLIIGNVINLETTPFGNKLYSTSEHVLEPYIHYRLLKHPNRVKDINDANIAFIPFYSHLLKFITKNGKLIPLNSIMEFVNSILPKITNRNIPHLIAYSDLGYNTKEVLRDMFKFSPNNFYFVCYEETQSISGYYLPNKGPSRVITVPYMSIIHKKLNENYEKFKIMKNRNLFACHVGSVNRWPIQYMSKYLSNPYFVTSENTNLRSVIELYSKCKFSIQPSNGEMGLSRHFFTSLSVGTIPVLFNSNEKSISSLFRGALDMDKMTIIIPNAIHQIRDEREQSMEIVKYLKSIPFNVVERKRKFIFENLQYLQYSMDHDEHDAIALMIGSVAKLNSILKNEEFINE